MDYMQIINTYQPQSITAYHDFKYGKWIYTYAVVPKRLCKLMEDDQ